MLVIRGIRVSTALAAAMAGLLLFGVAVAQMPPNQLTESVVGPYRLTVIAVPINPVAGAGGPRFSVRVLNNATGAPINDADVVIAVKRPDGTEAGQVSLARNPSTPGVYESRITLQDKGTWRWSAAVTTTLGLESIGGAIDVKPGPSAGVAGNWAWGGILLALGAVVFLARRNIRPKKPKQPNPQAAA